MSLSTNKRRKILARLGADVQDMETLLTYTSNTFAYQPAQNASDFLLRWTAFINISKEKGVAYAINKHLVKNNLQIDFEMPDSIHLEIYDSFAGKIPIITTSNDKDFESIVQYIVFKGKTYPHIKIIGAQYVHNKNNSFIILSHKPYSNIPADVMGLDIASWREKSYVIRKHHEYTHFYTNQYYGSSKNNLHDELIADFCGIWAAFSHYRADYFIKFLSQGRLKIYVDSLSSNGAVLVEKLAYVCAKWLEEWTKSTGFANLYEIERINFLCEKELLSFVHHDFTKFPFKSHRSCSF